MAGGVRTLGFVRTPPTLSLWGIPPTLLTPPCRVRVPRQPLSLCFSAKWEVPPSRQTWILAQVRPGLRGVVPSACSLLALCVKGLSPMCVRKTQTEKQYLQLGKGSFIPSLKKFSFFLIRRC